MGDAHGHVQSAAGRNKKSLAIVFGLTAFYLIVEVIGGLWTGSLALLADAGHMLTDVAGVGLALLAIWFAEKPASPEKTYGYYRVEILAAVDVPDPRPAGAIENQTSIASPALNGVEHVPICAVAQFLGTTRVGPGAVHEGLDDRVRAATRPRRIAAGPKRAITTRLLDR